MAWRPPRLGWLVPVGAVAAAAVLAVGLWRGGGLKAPDTPGACWRLVGERAQPPFVRIGGPQPDLDGCAAMLEYERLRGGTDVAGAYQGRFIFADAEMLGTGDTLHGARWRMFFDPQRAELDVKLRARIHQERALATVRAAPAPRS